MSMSKIYGGIMGVVVGDALGVPAEFQNRDTFQIEDMTGFGTYHQPPGTWSDDSSLTFAAMESMIRMGAVIPEDIMMNLQRWYDMAEFTPYQQVFDVGRATQQAILRWKQVQDIDACGGVSARDNGNGALMRILPVILFSAGEKDSVLINEVERTAKLTHNHIISHLACFIYALIVKKLLQGGKKEEALEYSLQTMKNLYGKKKEWKIYERLCNIQDLKREEIRSSGYVVDTLEAAVWCFLTTDTYKSCTLKAVNLGLDTDTIAAVAGGMAGIYYGCGREKGIPEAWIKQIARKDWVVDLCRQFEAECNRHKNHFLQS